MMAEWTHLFPYRTQKLSTSAPNVVPSGARLGHCQAILSLLLHFKYIKTSQIEESEIFFIFVCYFCIQW